jgi:hypothetical protein
MKKHPARHRALRTRTAKPRKKRGAERRGPERVPLGVPVLVRGIDDHGHEFQEFTTAFNIGSGGALLATRRPLALSSNISIEIPKAPRPGPAMAPNYIRNLSGQSVSVSHSDRCYLVGVKFSEPLRKRAKKSS